MGKLKYNPCTLDCERVKDGLTAASQLDDNAESKGLWFVVGGVATQSYIPTSCRRPTSDIDLAVLKPLTYSDFRTFCKPAEEYLKDKGYLVEERKGQNAYMLIYSSPNDEACSGTGLIEFARKSPANFAKIEKRLQREIANSRKKIIEGREQTYSVSSPEDIVNPKLVRTIHSLERGNPLLDYAEKAYPMSDKDIIRYLNEIKELREEAMLNIGDADLSNKLRFASDVYDIRILSESVGFNEHYFLESMCRWSALRERTPTRDYILASLLPKLSEDFLSNHLVKH